MNLVQIITPPPKNTTLFRHLELQGIADALTVFEIG